MKLYIYAARDLHDDKPHIFYSEDFTPEDNGNEYEVLKSFFVDYLKPEDGDYYNDFIQKVDGRDSIVIPKGEIITITETNSDGTFCFEVDGLEFCIPADIDTPMYLRCLDSELVACDIMGADQYDPDDDEDLEEDEDEEEYDPYAYGQHSEDWYIARDHGDDTDPFM